jgi:hypothetical protein
MAIPEGRKAHAVALAVLLLIPLVFFWEMVVENREPAAPDTQAVQPLSAWSRGAKQATGETPLWCPMIFSGMPSYGSFIHTPSSSFDVTKWLRAPFHDRRGARYFVALIIGALSTYLLLLLRRKHPLSALGGALVFVMTPYFLGLIAAGHSTKLQTLYLAPLVLLAIDVFLRKRTLASVAFLAAAIAVQLWNSHPQISYYTLLLGGLYAILVLIWERPERWHGRRLLTGVLLGVLALLLAAGLVLEPYGAVLEYTPYSIRGEPGVFQEAQDAAGGAGWEYATAWSYPPEELLCFLFPSWFGLEGNTYWGGLPFTQSTHYFGMSVLLLGFFGLVFARGRRKWMLLALAGVVLVIGFGRHLPLLYWPMYKFLPMFSRFRVPSMIYALLPLFMALLSTEGLEGILRGGPWVQRRGAARSGDRKAAARAGAGRKAAARGGAARKTSARDVPRGWGERILRKWWLPTLVLLALLVIWMIVGASVTKAMHSAGGFVRADDLQRFGAQAGLVVAQRMDLLRDSVTLGLVLLALCALLIEGRRRGFLSGPLAAGLLVVVVVADLWIVDRKFYRPESRARTEAILQEDDIVRFLKEREKPFRVAPLTRTEFSTNRYAAFGIESVGGYQPAKLRIYDDLIRSGAISSLPVLAMLNARYIVTDQALPEDRFPLVARASGSQGLRVYENPAALPRAWFVAQARTTSDPRALLEQIASPEFDPSRTAWLQEDEAAGIPSAFSEGQVRSCESGAQLTRLDVSVAGPAPALLVMSEISYPPGWVARIDGEETAILRVNHVLRALLVPPGEHEICVEAVSRKLRGGILASRICAAIVLLLLLAGPVGRFVGRRRTQAAPAGAGREGG